MITSSLLEAVIAPQTGARGSGTAVVDAEVLAGRELESYEEFRAANELYTRVFGYSDPAFSLNPNLLSALGHNGGSAVGVFTPGDRLVGFAYGFAGRDGEGRDYHYSQSAVVDPAYQGRGIGRQLKFLQRRVAERWGHDTMRWTFDPVLSRNGHFNFSTLGAVGTEYLVEYYGRDCTDRLVVEWSLHEAIDRYAAARAIVTPALTRDIDLHPFEQDGGIWVPFSTDRESTTLGETRARLCLALSEVLDGSRVLIDCRRVDDSTALYLATKRVGGVADTSTGGHAQEAS